MSVNLVHLMFTADDVQRNAVATETPGHAWQFFINHFQNQTQARRDNKYAYRQSNGSFYVGLDPPEDAEP